jgi:N-acetylmuramoyl-L-alanine amidase
MRDGGRRRDRAGVTLTTLLVVGAVFALAACTGAQAGSGEPSVTSRARHSAAPPTTAAPSTRKSATPTTPAKPAATPRPKPKPKAVPKLQFGSQGAAVAALQRQLHALGYEAPAADGHLGSETSHAVVAFQKVDRLSRDGVAGPITLGALRHPKLPSPRSHAAGFHVEADLTLQVVYLVQDGRVTRILDASSGSGLPYSENGDSGVAITPLGNFQVQHKINDWHKSKLGLLYRPAFFDGGFALHGALSVPPFPASHGCIRITTAAMDQLYDRLPIGTPVLVYRS